MEESIWFLKDVTVDKIFVIGANTMSHFLEIEFVELGPDFLKARMPVADKTRQPYGLLHGGASAALAETVGSIASALVIDTTRQKCVGLEINANHLKGVREGYVYATASPLHLGKATHVWDIRITNESNQLVCISRLTVAVLQ